MQLEVSTSQIERTPSQKFADLIIGRFPIKSIGFILKKVMPGVDILEALESVENPLEWHNALTGINAVISRVLQEDHDGGYITDCSCLRSTRPTESSYEGGEEGSTESVLRGDDRQREEYTDAGASGQLSEDVLNEESSSENVDSGHEAEIQSSNGTQRLDDWGEW